MKCYFRIFILFFTVVLSVSFLVVPASAADSDSFDNSNFLNVLDYCTPNDSGYYTVNYNSGDSASFNFAGMLYYIDIVVSHSANNITAANFLATGLSVPLTVTPIGNGLFRIYGELPGYNRGSFSIQLFVPSYSAVSFISLNVRTLPLDHFSEIAEITASDGNGFDGYAIMHDSSTPVKLNFPFSASTNMHYQGFHAYIDIPDWEKYDYVDICFDAYLNGINSIYASFGDISVPCEITYLANSLNDTYIQTCTVLARLDLRGLDRTSSNKPLLVITGKYFKSSPHISSNNYIKLNYASGYVVANNSTPFLYYFESLKSSISSGLSEVRNTISSWSQSIINNINNLKDQLSSKLDLLIDDIIDMKVQLSSKLDQLIGGTTEGDVLTQDSEQISSGLDDIDSFENSQQEVLDNNFPEIQNTVTITNFTAALAFVQRYTNLAFTGISDFSIVYTLPIFLGLFFYICSRVPGVTRRSKPPKDGDST